MAVCSQCGAIELQLVAGGAVEPKYPLLGGGNAAPNNPDVLGSRGAFCSPSIASNPPVGGRADNAEFCSSGSVRSPVGEGAVCSRS